MVSDVRRRDFLGEWTLGAQFFGAVDRLRIAVAARPFIPPERARAWLAAIGAEQADRVVCYCGGGISATMGLFLLHRLGYDNLALYDASMAEWARDETLPIERG